MHFSFIIPVFNRPDEIEELLESLLLQDYKEAFEIVVVEDGSTIPCLDVIEKFSHRLDITYFNKPNSGPGDSRNYGMKHAKGDYFIILDSDCILPKNYLTSVARNLTNRYVDCFGGPDAAHHSFTNVQKAINYTMTSLWTTGGIRGGSEKIDKFQPRSFNMGISKVAFEASGGYGLIHPGEDPDLSIRLWKLHFKTALFEDSYVFHKRRIDFDKFYVQVNKFGKARPILNHWYPEYAKLTYWFPACFIIGFIFSMVALFFNINIGITLYILYILLIFVDSSLKNNNVKIGFLSVLTTIIQFYGYGRGFIKAFVMVSLLKKKPQDALPEMFFKIK